MGDKITALPAATSLDGTEVSPVVQAGTTKKVTGTILRSPIGTAGGDLAGTYPNPTLAVVTTNQSVGGASTIPIVTVDTKGRVTALSSAPNTMGTVTNVTAGTGLSGGPITAAGTLSVLYGTTAGTAAQGNDGRFATIPAASAVLPSPNGAAAIGTSASFARADHVHAQGSVALSGDITGSGTGSIVTSLANITSPQTNVGDVNQIPRISIDAKGRVTNLTTVANPQTAISGLTGDIQANGPGVVNAQLSASGVTAGTYGYAAQGRVPSITVDAKGRIGAASAEVIVLPTEKTSTTVLNTLAVTKTAFFTNNTGAVPYSLGQWITVSAASPSLTWMSGKVTGCTASSVSFAVTQASSFSSATQASWNIRLGQTINYFATGAPTDGQVLQYNSGVWGPATGGDATSLRGYPIGSGYTPNTGDGLVWTGTEWRPQAGGSSNATAIQSIGVSSATPLPDQALVYNGSVWLAAVPNANAVKIQGRDITDSIPDDRMSLTWLGGPTGSWQAAFTTELAGTNLQFPLAPTDGQVLGWDNTNSVWKPVDAGSGNATQIQSRDVADTLPTDGQVLAWDDANSTWKPAAASSGADATSLRGNPIADPLSGNNGDVLTWNGAQWQPSIPSAKQLNGTNVSTTAPSLSQALVYNGTEWAPATVNAVQLQGQPVSSSAPGTNNLLRFDGTSWVPFDGVAIPNWNGSTNYTAGDRVWHDGKIWVCMQANGGNTPSTGSVWWAENIGSNSGSPFNQGAPAYWLRITTPAGDGYMPIYT